MQLQTLSSECDRLRADEKGRASAMQVLKDNLASEQESKASAEKLLASACADLASEREARASAESELGKCRKELTLAKALVKDSSPYLSFYNAYTAMKSAESTYKSAIYAHKANDTEESRANKASALTAYESAKDEFAQAESALSL